MKLLLIFPNTANWPAISTAIPILFKIARLRGWETRYFDTYNYKKAVDSNNEKEMAGGFKPGYSNFDLSKERKEISADLQALIDEFSPDIIAVTGLTCDYNFFMTFFPNLELSETTIVIIGGICSFFDREAIIDTKLFDLVAFSEAEAVFPEVLKRIENRLPVSDIEGTYYCDKKTSEIVRHAKRPLLCPEKLWEYGGDYSLFNDEYFLRPFNGQMVRRMDVEVGRGCPYDCAYCGNSALKAFHKGLGQYVKTRPVSSAVAQMTELKANHTIEMFQFTDECFLAHPVAWLKIFFNAYSSEINLPFIFQTRPETIDEQKIDMIRSYDIPFQVSIGVESGSEHILNEICNRKCTNEQIIKAFDILNQRRIRTNAFFMIGFPFETRTDIFKTISLYRRIKPSVASVAIFQPLLGQKIRDVCIENGFMSGQEIDATFTSHSLLKMPKPYLSGDEIRNLWRTFVLYGTLPKKYYPDIEKCEKDFDGNKALFNRLIALRWEKYDYAKEKGDLPLWKQ